MTRRKRYSAEFKRQALKRADEPGVMDALVCEESGISTRQLRRWRDLVVEHGAENAFPGHGKSRDQELTELRRELAKVKAERDRDGMNQALEPQVFDLLLYLNRKSRLSCN